MAQVLLINPPYSFTGVVKLKNKKQNGGFYISYPHLGLGYLSSYLKKEGFTVRIVDASVELLDIADIIEIIKREKPLLTGITVTTPMLRTVYEIVKSIQSEKIDTEIVLGGSHISIDPELIKDLGVKYGFVGEAEIGLSRLCGKLLKKEEDFESVDGLVYNDKGRYFANPIKFISDLDALPFPDRDAIDNDKYFSPVVSGRITSMITSRGCPFGCSYCSRPAIGRKVRNRSIINIIDEIALVTGKYGVKYINFEDDTFTLDKDRAREICETILERGLKVLWGCQTRANLVDYDLLALMKKSGCIKISFGIEAGAERVRYIINKKIKNEDFERAYGWANRLGIDTNAYIMFGHPTETIADMEESIKFTVSLNPSYAAFYITAVLPGSTLCEELIAKGKLVHPEIWRKYMRGEAELPSYIPEGLNEGILKAMLKKAFRRFYLRPGYILGRLKRIRSLADIKRNIKSGWVVMVDYIT